MGYLTTILTYNIPAEAEVDKAFLESRGIAVCLLNANTSRNELGAPFYVQLQVNQDEAENARNLIMQVNPRRFGSSERVAEIDRQLRRSAVRFALGALPLGIAVGLAAYFVTPKPIRNPTGYVRRHWVTYDVRVELGVVAGIAACAAVSAWDSRRRQKGKGPLADPPPSAT
jgi:hypothetical protein